jgi:pimeloyl-ACP methyl ester carboxylesterase
MKSGFEPRLAAGLARLVIDAYAEFERKGLQLPKGVELLAELRGGAAGGVPECFGFVARGAGHRLVALRGTDSFPDLLDDAEVGLVPMDGKLAGLRCAEGVARLSASLRDRVRSALATGGSAPVVLVGHSLGGAVVAVLGLELALEGEAVGVVSFGASRPGDRKFARSLSRNVPQAWRVVNPKDLVPHWPPAWLCYRHGGHAVKVRFRDAEGPLENHSMARYCRAVEVLAGEGAGAREPIAGAST